MEATIRIDDRFTVARFAPDREALRQAAREGFRSVVNLRTADEKQELRPDEEGRLAEQAGLAYLHHPVSGEGLADEVVDGFRRKVADLPAPVLVHCASGKRSGALVMMHLASEQGWSGEQVLERAESMGFECDTPQLEAFVKSYVDRHNGS
jgi:uncharacterized protein (TIGR01244 family)